MVVHNKTNTGAFVPALLLAAGSDELELMLIDDYTHRKNYRMAAKCAAEFERQDELAAVKAAWKPVKECITGKEYSSAFPVLGLAGGFHHVTTRLDLEAAIRSLEEYCCLCDGFVGVDAEWQPNARRPRNGEGAFTPVALLQVAFPGSVYIIDFIALCATHRKTGGVFGCPACSLVLKLIKVLFTQAILVGFGLAGDIQRVARSFRDGCHLSGSTELQKAALPSLVGAMELDSTMPVSVLRSIDIQAVIAGLKMTECQLDVPLGQSLGGACCAFLSARMCKDQQKSNWGDRPLTSAQLNYAALDAQVLLPLLCAVLGTTSRIAFADLWGRLDGGLSAIVEQKQHTKYQIPIPCCHNHTSSGTPLGKVAVETSMAALGCAVVKWLRFGCDRPASRDLGPGLPLIAKTIILVMPANKILACVLEADARLHLAVCAEAVGLQRHEVRLAAESELVDLCGHRRGSIGPVGLRSDPTLLIDTLLMSRDEIYVGGGEADLHCAVSPAMLAAKMGAVFANISEVDASIY
jgi:prolyl-tRNA editing enzyme YbaK/EbsC (Cys-tRNA(Pro) deacylase)